MYTNNEKPGTYTGFFLKKNNGLQTAVRGGSEGTLIPKWAPAEKGGGQPKMTPHRDKKVPYIVKKLQKGPLYSKKRKIFQGRERSPSLAPLLRAPMPPL